MGNFGGRPSRQQDSPNPLLRKAGLYLAIGLELPGAVLAVDINSGERVIVAQQVELKNLKKNDLKKPSSGEKTTSAGFRAMVDEQMKKMGGQGGMIIRN